MIVTGNMYIRVAKITAGSTPSGTGHDSAAHSQIKCDGFRQIHAASESDLTVTREMVLIKTRNGFDRTFDAKSRLDIYFA